MNSSKRWTEFCSISRREFRHCSLYVCTPSPNCRLVPKYTVNDFTSHRISSGNPNSFFDLALTGQFTDITKLRSHTNERTVSPCYASSFRTVTSQACCQCRTMLLIPRNGSLVLKLFSLLPFSLAFHPISASTRGCASIAMALPELTVFDLDACFWDQEMWVPATPSP